MVDGGVPQGRFSSMLDYLWLDCRLNYLSYIFRDSLSPLAQAEKFQSFACTPPEIPRTTRLLETSMCLHAVNSTGTVSLVTTPDYFRKRLQQEALETSDSTCQCHQTTGFTYLRFSVCSPIVHFKITLELQHGSNKLLNADWLVPSRNDYIANSRSKCIYSKGSKSFMIRYRIQVP